MIPSEISELLIRDTNDDDDDDDDGPLDAHNNDVRAMISRSMSLHRCHRRDRRSAVIITFVRHLSPIRIVFLPRTGIKCNSFVISAVDTDILHQRSVAVP